MLHHRTPKVTFGPCKSDHSTYHLTTAAAEATVLTVVGSGALST